MRINFIIPTLIIGSAVLATDCSKKKSGSSKPEKPTAAFLNGSSFSKEALPALSKEQLVGYVGTATRAGKSFGNANPKSGFSSLKSAQRASAKGLAAAGFKSSKTYGDNAPADESGLCANLQNATFTDFVDVRGQKGQVSLGVNIPQCAIQGNDGSTSNAQFKAFAAFGCAEADFSDFNNGNLNRLMSGTPEQQQSVLDSMDKKFEDLSCSSYSMLMNVSVTDERIGGINVAMADDQDGACLFKDAPTAMVQEKGSRCNLALQGNFKTDSTKEDLNLPARYLIKLSASNLIIPFNVIEGESTSTQEVSGQFAVEINNWSGSFQLKNGEVSDLKLTSTDGEVLDLNDPELASAMGKESEDSFETANDEENMFNGGSAADNEDFGDAFDDATDDAEHPYAGIAPKSDKATVSLLTLRGICTPESTDRASNCVLIPKSTFEIAKKQAVPSTFEVLYQFKCTNLNEFNTADHVFSMPDSQLLSGKPNLDDGGSIKRVKMSGLGPLTLFAPSSNIMKAQRIKNNSCDLYVRTEVTPLSAM